MTEDNTNKPEVKPVFTDRVLQGRQPVGITLLPVEPSGAIHMVDHATTTTEDRGRRPVPTTPAPAPRAPSPTPSTTGKK